MTGHSSEGRSAGSLGQHPYSCALIRLPRPRGVGRGVAIGVQLGFNRFRACVSQKGAEQILNGKSKLGSDAAAAAGPTGAASTSCMLTR